MQDFSTLNYFLSLLVQVDMLILRPSFESLVNYEAN